MPHDAQVTQDLVHICMVEDEGSVMPACVTINSIFRKKKTENKCVVHIVAASLSEKSKRQLLKLSQPGCEIDIVEATVTQWAQAKEKDIATLGTEQLVFYLPELFPQLNRVLYLNSSLIVREDLKALWMLDIESLGGYLAAAVKDSKEMYVHEDAKQTRACFNSGVMLLNLERMRCERTSDKLLQTQMGMNDSQLTVQDTFNLIMGGRVWTLPIRYNYMPGSLDRMDDQWTEKDVNEHYGTNYQNKKEILMDACIVHFVDDAKPWEALDGPCADWWIENYLAAPIPHDLISLPERKEPFGISIIMPCYNVEGYVQETMDSLFAQTYQDFELICLDDGSTDGTLHVLQEAAQIHPCMKVIANENHRQGWERNQGIRQAQGKYLYFMDSDDLLSPECLQRLYTCAENNRLDAVYFEGDSFYESEALKRDYPQYLTSYCREHWYPEVYTGEQLFVRLHKHNDWSVSPCLQMIQREFLIENDLFFPELPRLEDNVYTTRAILKAKRVKCLPDTLFHRRVRDNSTMTVKRVEREEVKAYAFITSTLIGLAFRYEEGEVRDTLLKWSQWFVRMLVKKQKELSDDQADTIVDESMRAHDLLGALAYYGAVPGEFRRNSRASSPAVIEKQWSNRWARRFYKVSMKICGGIQCLADNGLGYTVKRGFKKLAGKLRISKK